MKKKNKNLYEFSKQENLRFYVIEHTIEIEDLISETLGKILDIDYLESKSFGFKSSSLSFNQKAQIIQDLRGMEKEELKKLSCLMNIRNKFAHVKQIENFDDLFIKTPNGKQIKNNLERWYDNGEFNNQDRHRLYFVLLIEDLIRTLCNIQMNYVTEQFRRKRRKDFFKEYVKQIQSEIKKLELENNIHEIVINKVKEILRRNN